MENIKLYYICHNSLCGNKIAIEDLYDLDDDNCDESIPTIRDCECCHDEMILTRIDEED